MVNKKVKIRIAQSADASGILEIYKSYILESPITFEELVPSVSDFSSRIANILEECPFLVCEINGEIAGYAYASDYRSRAAYRWNKEVSVSAKFQRKNIALALYTVLFSILKTQGFANLLAVITLPNNASIALHESFGFKKCAEFQNIGFKNNQWHTVGWWDFFLLNENDQIPKEPIPFRNFIKENSLNNFIEEGESLLKI